MCLVSPSLQQLFQGNSITPAAGKQTGGLERKAGIGDPELGSMRMVWPSNTTRCEIKIFLEWCHTDFWISVLPRCYSQHFYFSFSFLHSYCHIKMAEIVSIFFWIYLLLLNTLKIDTYQVVRLEDGCRALQIDCSQIHYFNHGFHMLPYSTEYSIFCLFLHNCPMVSVTSFEPGYCLQPVFYHPKQMKPS